MEISTLARLSLTSTYRVQSTMAGNLHLLAIIMSSMSGALRGCQAKIFQHILNGNVYCISRAYRFQLSFPVIDPTRHPHCR